MAITKKRTKQADEPIPLHAVCAGKPIPKDFCDQLEGVIADARVGKVTSLAWVAIGPEFARWENAFTRGRSDRLNILGQLAVITSELAAQEVDSEDEE